MFEQTMVVGSSNVNSNNDVNIVDRVCAMEVVSDDGRRRSHKSRDVKGFQPDDFLVWTLKKVDCQRSSRYQSSQWGLRTPVR